MFFVIGPFPPPVHGMGKNLLVFYNSLCKAVGKQQVAKIDISPGSLTRGGKYHATKILKVLFGTLKVFFLGLLNFSKRNVIYMPVDAGWGVIYSTLLLSISRLLGMDIFIHHRSYAYINRHSKLMRVFVFIGGKNSTHIFLCKNQEEKYRKFYKFIGKSIVVSNAGHVEPARAKKDKNNKKIIIGFLSNISEEKGILDTIEIFKVLKNQNYPIELHIAGPFDNKSAEELVKENIRALKGVQVFGPVYELDKHNFFSNIDILIFPTKYKNEAQPNVVFEAMSYFVRPITTNIGCLSSDFILGGCDTFQEKGNSFVLAASSKIEQYIADRNYLREQQKKSHEIVSNMKASAEKSYATMLRVVIKDNFK